MTNEQKHKFNIKNLKNETNHSDENDTLSKKLNVYFQNKKNFNSLIAYCDGIIKSLTGCNNINGNTGFDYVSKAVLLILEGKRKFNESKYSLEKFIYLTCWSLIKNDVKKKRGRKKHFIEELVDFQAYEAFLLNKEEEDELIDNFSDINNTINDNAIDNSFIGENEVDINEKLFKILNYCKQVFLEKDDELCYVILDDIEKRLYPPEIYESNKRLAGIYHVDVKDIVNAKKRIKRVGYKYIKNGNV